MITLWAPHTRGKESLRDEISYANVQSCCLINPQWPNLARWHISDKSTLLIVTEVTGWRRSVRPLSNADRHLRPKAEVQRYSFRFGTEMEDGPRLYRQHAVFASLWAFFFSIEGVVSVWLHLPTQGSMTDTRTLRKNYPLNLYSHHLTRSSPVWHGNPWGSFSETKGAGTRGLKIPPICLQGWWEAWSSLLLR